MDDFRREIMDIVNEEDEVVGKTSKHEIYEKHLPHRIAHVLVFNDKGEMLLQLRSKNKKGYPGYWAPSAGGHVIAGEDYAKAALRELEEELGIRCRIKFLRKELFNARVFWNNKPIKKVIAYFAANHNGPFSANSEEVQRTEFCSLQKIRDMISNGEKIHPELAFFLETKQQNNAK